MFGKIGWTISQTPIPGSKHDKIRAWWALDIASKNILKKYDGVGAPRWTLEVESFVVWWVV
jgi:hypothetical protein